MFIATLPMPDWDGDPAEVVMHNHPGRALAIHPSRGKVLALFMFRAPMPSGFGDGSSSAMIGAAALAALAAHPHPQAFAAYERTHRRIVDPKQRMVFIASAMMVPASRAGIALRNFGSRVLARS